MHAGYSPPWALDRELAKDFAKDQKNLYFGKEGFHAVVDVHQFEPSEITVKTVDDQVIIEGKHLEKEDHHGSVERHFIRKYNLPKEIDMVLLHSELSSDGVLSIKAPPVIPITKSERAVSVHLTHVPVHLN